MVKLQKLDNKRQNKVSYTLNVPKDIIKILSLKKGDEFAVRFDKEKNVIEYIKI